MPLIQIANVVVNDYAAPMDMKIDMMELLQTRYLGLLLEDDNDVDEYTLFAF